MTLKKEDEGQLYCLLIEDIYMCCVYQEKDDIFFYV